MITATQLLPLRGQQRDLVEAEELKAKFAQLRQERQPFYLTAAEFDEILWWKLDRQYGRQRQIRTKNTDEIIRAVTGLALTISHLDKDYELELRVNILCSLRGVGVPVASAILALIFPSEYAVIDFRVWRQLFREQKSIFSVSDYKRYMAAIRLLATELGWPVQEVDHVIWEYDQMERAK